LQDIERLAKAQARIDELESMNQGLVELVGSLRADVSEARRDLRAVERSRENDESEIAYLSSLKAGNMSLGVRLDAALARVKELEDEKAAQDYDDVDACRRRESE
jgi:hypothetical protein